MNDGWIRVTATDNVPPREGRAVTLAGRELAIFNMGPSTQPGTGDRFLAIENRCPHMGGPLSDGIISGWSVVCPLHAWKVRLDTGAVDRPSSSEACVHAFKTRVEDGIVWVQIPAADDKPGSAERAA